MSRLRLVSAIQQVLLCAIAGDVRACAPGFGVRR